ncbi:NAD(P)H-dependent oxidoreductase [Clostridium algidicarnis]|uniref:NAD(P)H-dependent oxidoreductase n=1 Tax=Clostridium algidicarnis TaxID=37659 RepID=A0ABS6C1X0_9CLOT|nr:NAD(P)H-dependent oxidoreductase [Clostridium algidicarnis]MBB6631389.1 NAD(P)H-dependent oxidoreductase [Clostridium algidicarnis]MBU3219478.1 NAD(P)H-dependent oxidoreductase [Clostridium algidicarnis]MCB2287030.1 NAD(P)H-dependent oxidoreductase [Clostridium algidicarnis]
MKVLVLNGSPKGERSNTLKITKAFLEGLNKYGKNTIEIIDISKANIKHCTGCFACWTKTPGECVIDDHMKLILPKLTEADLIVWSFPLHSYSMPSKLKAFLDRTLPLMLPFMEARVDGGGKHDLRYDFSSKRCVLISSSGFYSTKNNYEAVLKQFRIIYGTGFKSIICTEGELLGVANLKKRVTQYLDYVKQAGVEYSQDGKFSKETKEKLSELLYPAEKYSEMADASWLINGDAKNGDGTYNFMRQMSAVYNPASYKSDVVLEMYFTDEDKTYQLCLEKDKCTLKTDNFLKYNTRIETSFELWQKISDGTIDGSEAMMNKQYKIIGDMRNMMNMSEYFGVSSSEKIEEKKKKSKSNMGILLLQWIIFWIVVPTNSFIGGILSIVACSTLSFFSSKFKLTIYEKASAVIISILSIIAMNGVNNSILICVSYLLFGVMWICSAFSKIPLTAYYSCNDYNGEEAFKNILFIKTNRILTVAWGILYLIIASYSYFLMNTSFSSYTGLINSFVPIFMGIFTAWFARWYPSTMARY